MTKKAYLIGHPLKHSVSPAMHNAIATDYYKYEPKDVKPGEIAKALVEFRKPEVIGFNVTIPHKEAILPFLDDLDNNAELIGAVNTVVNEDGRLVGHNTDGAGFIESLKQDAKIDPLDKNVVVIGAGGASRAVCVMLAEAKVDFLTVTDIAAEKAQQLVEYISSELEVNCNFVPANSPELQERINNADILVNCSPIGMHPKEDQSPLADNIKLHSNLMVYDLVYNPGVTKLMKAAEAAGARTCTGLGMLVRQGALAFTLWTGQEADIPKMRQAAEKALGLS
ncbi:MAG: shikimate dehydrogenase [bacterium]